MASPSLDSVQDAAALLASIGAEVCLSSSRLPNNADDYSTVLPVCHHGGEGESMHVFASKAEEEEFYLVNILLTFGLLIFVAIMSGLYLGLLTLEVLDLQIILRTSNDEDEKKYAATIMPLIQNRHKLLVTLLLVDTLAYETLPVFLEQLVPSWLAVLLSTTLILLLGEIIPTGIFIGPNQLYLAYKAAPMVKFFVWFLTPIAQPIASLLDYLTHDEDAKNSDYYNRDELTALVRIQHEQQAKIHLHQKTRGRKSQIKKYMRNENRQWNDLKAEILEAVQERNAEDDHGDDNSHAAVEFTPPPLHSTEIDMVEGALNMKTKLAMDVRSPCWNEQVIGGWPKACQVMIPDIFLFLCFQVYTPLRHLYSLPHDQVLDKRSITKIFSEAYSRVPVYQHDQTKDDEGKGNFLGFLMIRQLMLIDWDDERRLHTLYLQRPLCVSPRMNLVDLLRVLQQKGPQMTFVCARPDVANAALKAHLPIPDEAGMMGIVTIVDILEALIQSRIYDEEDIRERQWAIYTLQKFAAMKLQAFYRRRAVRRRSKSPVQRRSPRVIMENTTSTGASAVADETTPLLLLSSSPGDNGYTASNNTATSAPAGGDLDKIV